MKKIAFVFLFFYFNYCAANNVDLNSIQGLVTRVLPAHKDRFVFKLLNNGGNKDTFELESKGGNIIISGNNANSMAVGLNHYLKYYCLTTVSWYANDPVQLPSILPEIKSKISVDARCRNRFFLNYCTFGYTMPWWKWKDWERFIDWMALNGVNMPLAITGQETVWYKVWLKHGLTDKEIRTYFTGPAHLAWHRMSNLDYWQGDLPNSWLVNQEMLQKKIVARERQLNMRPVLPAFAGHVPKELKRIYPNAKITTLSEWGGFEDKYRSSFLDPMDTLFKTIQKEFLTEQTNLYGSDNIYGADPFNELVPPSWEPSYLATVSKTIYESISEVDPNAIWLQMSWLFYIDRQSWTNARVEAFLKAVPQDKMLLLDYYCDNTEVWKQTERFFGQHYVWCYLGNFGGNTMLAGNIRETGRRIENVIRNGGSNFWGIGSTLESFDVSPFMFEYVFEKAWSTNTTDELWIQKLADRYIGKPDPYFREAWGELLNKIYIDPAKLSKATLTNARPCFEGNGNWTTSPEIAYNNKDLLRIWGLMLSSKDHHRDTYLYNVVNVGRQVLGNYFLVLRDKFTEAYKSNDIGEMKTRKDQMISLLDDLDLLLSTHPSFSLVDWLQNAKQFGRNKEEKSYYEKNARTILTTWGDKDQSLNDYANRTWSGLVSSYYKPRWEMFLNQAIASVLDKTSFNEKTFHVNVTNFEKQWTESNSAIKVHERVDGISLADKLYNKYQSGIINNR